MNKKYWKIGTGAFAFIKRFAYITSNGYVTGTKISLFNEGNVINLVDDKGSVIYTFTSKSTAYQYFAVWEALGFICSIGNIYVINTNLTNPLDLIEFSKIYLKIVSKKRKIQRYRDTIAINVLSKIGVLNIEKIIKMNYSKTRGQLTIKDILDSISKYEDVLSKDAKFINLIKEKYDK